jgi:general secretion pathway protein B
MSYILEALKKAEQKREQEEPSRVPTFLTGTVRESGQRSRWPYVVAAALLLNAGLVIWRLVPRETPSAPPPVGISARPGPAAVDRAPAKDIKKPAPSAVGPRETPVFVASVAPSKPSGPSEPAPDRKVRVDKPQPAATERTASVNDLTETTPSPLARVDKSRPATSGRLFALNELPPAVRNALPEFKVSGHAYTPEPQTRVVRINEKILQEGQELSPGLKVEEIVPGGIIMSYGGYRFRIAIKEPQ